MMVFSVLAVVITVFYLTLLGIKALRASGRLRKTLPAPSCTPASISIMQPIRSGDSNLKATLEDTLLAHPDVELLWLVDEEDACARTICSDLATQYGHPRLRILTTASCPPRINPKLYKLEKARSIAQGQFLVVLDDDTRLPPSTLSAMVAALDEATVSTALPGYQDDGTLPSRLLATFVNDNAALTYLGLPPRMPTPTLNGMAWAVRNDVLTTLGGFAPSLGTLTDDLAVARQVLGNGGRIVQLPDPVHVATELSDLAAYVRQMHRWSLFALLLLRRQSWRNRLSIAIFQGGPPVLLWLEFACAALASFHVVAPLSLVVLLIVRTLVLRRTARITERLPTSFGLSLLSELMQPLHLLHAACNRKIIWRGRCYCVIADDCFEEISK